MTNTFDFIFITILTTIFFLMMVNAVFSKKTGVITRTGGLHVIGDWLWTKWMVLQSRHLMQKVKKPEKNPGIITQIFDF